MLQLAEDSLGIKLLCSMQNNLNFKKIENKEESWNLVKSRPLGIEYER